MSKKVHISTLTNNELSVLIKKTITKRGLPSSMVELLLETFALIYWVNNGFTSRHKEGREIVIRNITHVVGEYVIKPTEVK